MKKILISAGVIVLLAVFGVAYAAAVPSEPAVYDSVLSAPLGTSDTTIYLKSSATTQGTSLTGFNCFTIDVNTPTLEYVCGTVSGTQVTGLTRNIDFFTGTTTNGTAPSHRTGADVRITDFPFAQIVRNILSGSDVLPVTLHYTSGTVISGSDGQALVNVNLLNSTAISGAPNSSETVNGISQLATATQAASSTATGSTGARLVIPASIATSSDDVAGLHVVVTQNSGKINWNQIDLSTPFIITGGFLDTASTTMTATTTILAGSLTNGAFIFGTLPYKAPTSRGTANSVWTDDGNGNLSETLPIVSRYTYATTTAIQKVNGYATSSAITIPANFLTASSTIKVSGNFSCANNGSGTSATCSVYIVDNNGASAVISSDTGFVTKDSVSGTGTGFFNAVIFMTGSAPTAQVSQFNCAYIEAGSASTLAANNACVDTATAAQNWANSFSIAAVIRSNNTNLTATLSNLFIEVDK